MSIGDWELWMVIYLVAMVLFLVVFSRLSKVNQKLDELVERTLRETSCQDCERKYDQTDYSDELRGDK
jgi:hypothetical protein